MKSVSSMLVFFFALCFGVTAAADNNQRVHIEHARISLAAPTAPVAGGYLVLENKTGADDQLLSASAVFADKVEIHESIMDGGLMKMRQLPSGVALPKNGMVEFKRGGLHIMFMKLNRVPTYGAMESVVLHFEKAGKVVVEFLVTDSSAATAESHGHDEKSDDHASSHSNSEESQGHSAESDEHSSSHSN